MFLYINFSIKQAKCFVSESTSLPLGMKPIRQNYDCFWKSSKESTGCMDQ